MTTEEAKTWIERRINLKRRHTNQCQADNRIKEWDELKRRCSCPYWSCGVHAPGEKFSRRATGEFSIKRAEEVLLIRLETGNKAAKPIRDDLTQINVAIEQFIQYTKDGGAEDSSIKKYQTLMDQLQAFCDWKGFRYVQEFNQEAANEFRRAWEDADAGYKQNHFLKSGRRRWLKMSVKTARRQAKILKVFFKFCILRKWVVENPTGVLRFPKESNAGRKKKGEIKYLTDNQMIDIVWAVEKFDRMPADNKTRLKALIYLLRWSGLRISDAVTLTVDKLKGDVLMLETKKASTDVQIPLPPEAIAELQKLTPYDGGYLFWNRQSDGADPDTPRNNYSADLVKVFKVAGVREQGSGLAHRFRNTFAVKLLEKGVPLETVSLMLGHSSIAVTDKYYGDYSKTYMDRAEALVRRTWTMTEGEKLW